MRIGLVATTFWPILGGMEIYLRQLAVHLGAMGHDVHVAARHTEKRPPDMKSLLSSRQQADSYRTEGYRVHIVDPGRAGTLLLKPTYRLHFYAATRSAASTLFSVAFRNALANAAGECDVLHYSGTGRELLGFACADLARSRGIPLVITPHVHIDAWGDGEIDLELYRRAACVIALTEVEKNHLVEKGLHPERIAVQGHGVNVDGSGEGAAFKARLNIEGPMVLYIGRKNRYKGYERLLRAAPRVWGRVPGTVFVIAGPAEPGFEPAADLQAVIRDHRVIDIGSIDERTREDILDACDVFCLPSEAEAFGLVFLEAGRYGKPVVGLDIPTLRELIGTTGTGILVPDDARALADSLVHLLLDPGERNRLGSAGRRVAENATWNDVALFLQSLYTRLGADAARA